jgi:hypothetical protein
VSKKEIIEEIRNFFEMSDNENITTCRLQLKKFRKIIIDLDAYIR